ncbi:hypothetical protein CRUP_028279 [Coryphaenoides rupestris]|nr:hypothetical protein CRUP_028279 [Coryphaenoides rupestris]
MLEMDQLEDVDHLEALEDLAAQYALEESLRDKNTLPAPDTSSSSAESNNIFKAIREGEDELKSQVKVMRACSGFYVLERQTGLERQTAEDGFHFTEAAAQCNQTLLELTYRDGPRGAVGQGLMENAHFLLQQGARPDTSDNNKDTPLLLEGRVREDKLCTRPPAGEPATAAALLEVGGQVDPRSNYDLTPLALATLAGHTDIISTLLERGLADAGYDPNFMLHQCVRRNYDDERRSALSFAVSNGDMASVKLLLAAGARTNRDPVSCLQVALRLGNYELIHLLLQSGANVNYYSTVNTPHFPSALQYALRDPVLLRMLCNYGYNVERCFDCRYGDASHVPEDYEGWSDTVIKDTMFCEVITISWLRHLSGQVVRILLDYVDHVTLCSQIQSALRGQDQWAEICLIQESARSLQHLCRLAIRRCLGLRRLRAPVFISFLPLPQRLKDYILFKEHDLYSQQRTQL